MMEERVGAKFALYPFFWRCVGRTRRMVKRGGGRNDRLEE